MRRSDLPVVIGGLLVGVLLTLVVITAAHWAIRWFPPSHTAPAQPVPTCPVLSPTPAVGTSSGTAGPHPAAPVLP